MKKSLLVLFHILFVSASIFAQSPEIKIHSFSPDVLETNKNIELNITLINKGDAATENNIVATLTSDNEYVTVINGDATIGNIAPDETQEAKFVVMINELCPDKNDITFSLNTVLDGSSEESSLSFDFEDGFQGWTSIDADGDGFKWISTTTKLGAGYGHESDFCVFSQSYDNIFEVLYPDNYFISPEKFKIGKNATFSFWACAQDFNYPAEHFGLAVSTEGNTSADDFTTIKEWTMTADDTRDQGPWHHYTIDLNEYEGQEIWIAIRHFNCFDEYFLMVDDIEVDNILQPKRWNEEISVRVNNPTPEIVATTIQHDDIAAGKEINIDITFSNKGTGASAFNTMVTLTAKDEFVTVVEGEKALAPMECGEEITHTFVIKTEASMPENHIIDLSLNILPENVSDNVISFNYGFEEDLNGWTTLNADGDDHTWYHTDSADVHSVSRIASHSGKGHIMSESFCNTYMESLTLTPDDYIVSPIMIGVTDSTTFSFWACLQDEDYNEHFGLAISTATAPTDDDFITIEEWDIKEMRATEWKHHSVDLGEYAGEFIWVALRHFNSSNKFVLCVDDASIDNFTIGYNWGKSFILVSDETSITEENIALNIYPNPVQDRLYVETLNQTQTVEIYDVYGRVQNLRNSETQKLRNSIDVTDLNSGVYFVKVVTENGEAIKRVVKN